MTMTSTPPPGLAVPRPEQQPNAPLPPARRVTLVLGTLLSVGAIGFTTVEIVGDLTETTVERTFSARPAGDVLTVRTHLGAVRVSPSGDDRVHVTRTASFSVVEPEFAEGEDGSGLASGLLSASCPESWPGACDVDYVVAVPAGMDVVVSSDHGDVRVEDVPGAVDATTSTGVVAVDGLDGVTRLRTDTGDVVASDLRSDEVDADSSTGDVRLLFAEAPRTVSASSNVGNVEVLVPNEGEYRVTATTEVGDRTVTVAVDDASSRSITATTDTGDVEVLVAGPGRFRDLRDPRDPSGPPRLNEPPDPPNPPEPTR